MRVTSRDGTGIACWASGEGPPLVMVHGATADHSRWQPLLPHLEPHARVCAMDRRGRGASGDGPEYHLAREWEDVAAVVDAVAGSTGSAVDLYGHSFGGLCAYGGATLTTFGTSDEEIAGLRAQPAWRARVAAAATIPRELRGTGEARLDPAQAAKITVPTLLLTGAESNDPATVDLPAVAAALPDARVVVIEGQGHLADVLAPGTLAGHLLAFLRG
jgi:pimeloyl-ACP methyl ester carboxylesterase